MERIGQYKNYPAALIFLLCLISCAPLNISHTVAPYADKLIQGKRLVIAPFFNEPYIEYTGNLEDEFGKGDKRELILNHFKEALVLNINNLSTFSEISVDEYSVVPKLDTAVFELEGRYKLRLALPADSQTIQFKHKEADFILFLQDVTMGTYQTGAPGGPGIALGGGFGQGPVFVGGTVGSSSKNLGYQAKFAIWDNVNLCAVTYGKIKVSVEADNRVLFSVITLEHWSKIDEDFAYELIQMSPFRKN